MKFKYLYVSEGISNRRFDFSDNINLIYSVSNSCGKTTLLRLILYALGYSIPSTKNIKFERCSLKLVITVDGEDIIIKRAGEDVVLIKGCEEKNFLLPVEESKLHSEIFNCADRYFAHNLLGAFYIDQEKGWTLLNRGKIIGQISFNVEEFVLWLAGYDISVEKQEQKIIESEIKKYTKLKNLSDYHDQIADISGDLSIPIRNDELLEQAEYLNFQLGQINAEMKKLDQVITGNKKFVQFIQDLKITVVAPSTKESFPLKIEYIADFDDNYEILKSKRKILNIQKSKLLRRLDEIEEPRYSSLSDSSSCLGLVETMSLLDKYERQFSTLNINQIELKKAIQSLNSHNKQLKAGLKKRVLEAHGPANDLYEIISCYIEELGVAEYVTGGVNFVLTSDLKSLSGAILHKIVFAFKLAYVKLAEVKLGYKLPIIIDSPSGKEVDKENITLMMNILKRDFSCNQIIIASIFKYDFEPESFSQIIINKKLIPILGHDES